MTAINENTGKYISYKFAYIFYFWSGSRTIKIAFENLFVWNPLGLDTQNEHLIDST